MDALKRNYPNIFQDNIIQSEDFFQKYDNFLVLAYSKKCTSHDIHCPKWFEKRIRRNADYVTTKLDSFDNMDLLVVESKK